SLAAASQALKLRPGDKHCLVARSKCYLRLGDTENALKDAEASLQSDKTFSKGLYQKAEALYTMGDFEFALVLYHRGRSLHPDLQKLSLGIEKAQEAIVNCIGSPSSVKLQCTEELRFVSRQAESKKANQKPQIKLSKDQKWAKKEKPVRNPRAERQLLGELYADKTYLEELLKDKGCDQSPFPLPAAREGVSSRARGARGTFPGDWRQEHRRCVRGWELTSPRLGLGLAQISFPSPASPHPHTCAELPSLSLVLAGGCPGEGCQQAECVLRAVQRCPEQELPNKAELLGSLHSRMGSAQLQMGQVEAALQSHQMDLKCAEQNNLPEAVSRALDNIGRVYTRTGRFQEAIATWEKKIPMAKSSLEKAWLFHELGQCYLQLNRAEAARGYGEKSLKAAEQEGDVEWQLHATLLVAEAQVQLEDHWAAILAFERALEKAKLIGNKAAQKAITAALDEASKSFVE
ncbi:Tetratricopeptide repeat protein 25, partial [Dryobates pubescens]